MAKIDKVEFIDGNDSVKDVLGIMPMKNNKQANPYGEQSKGPKLPTTKIVQKGYSK